MTDLAPAAPPAGLLDAAISQYPLLGSQGLQYKENYGGGKGFLEFWPPGEVGDDTAKRPEEFALDKPGVEIYDPKTRPIDVLGDVVSHHMINSDPTIKKSYGDFVNSLEPWQHQRLQEQYDHAKTNYGEARSFDEWKGASGLPAYFRGYPFQQWEKPEEMYTPSQMQHLDEMMGYLRMEGARQKNQINQQSLGAASPSDHASSAIERLQQHLRGGR